MLTVHLNALLTKARDALLHGSPDARATVAAQINDLLTNHADAVLATGRGKGRGRTASSTYKVSATGHGAATLLGARAAHVHLQQTLAGLGHPRRAPSLATLQVALSRAGHWACTVDTDNGAVEILVTKD